jgi:hypothetical protein
MEKVVGFYSQVIFPRICDFVMGWPFVAKYRQEMLAHASGEFWRLGSGPG